MPKAKLVIFRHGQTEYNKNHLMTGIADVPLTALGEEQAAEAGKRIAHLDFDKVYASTLSRAFNTAAIALKSAGKAYSVEKRPEIVEIDTGDFTGRPHKTDPEILAWERIYDRPLPGGESDKQAVARVRAFYTAEIEPRLARGENVLVVVHAGIVRAFDIVLGVEEEPVDGLFKKRPRSIPNAVPTVFEFEDGKLSHFYTLDTPPSSTPANDRKPALPPPQKKNRL